MKEFTINLQLFSEDDGFEEVTTESTETVETSTPTEEIEQQTEVETETPTEEPKQEQTEQKAEVPKVKLKYNHEEKEYSLDDVVPLAQKGLNYDKLQEKFNSIQNDPRLSKYDRVQQASELLGYQSDDELLDALFETYYNSTAEKQGITPEQVKKDHELTQKERAIQQKEEAQKQADANQAMYSKFLKMFPGVKPEQIKTETWQKVDQGVDLTAAYIEQRNQELETKLKILEQNAQNVSKAPVASVTAHGGANTTKKDAFLEGFDED